MAKTYNEMLVVYLDGNDLFLEFLKGLEKAEIKVSDIEYYHFKDIKIIEQSALCIFRYAGVYKIIKSKY